MNRKKSFYTILEGCKGDSTKYINTEAVKFNKLRTRLTE